jgi:hypothetical protein
MNKLVEYCLNDGENIATVDREKEFIHMYERGGWSRSYILTFKELLNYAKQWDIEINLKDTDEKIAEVGTKIILANNAVEHGLNPFRYISKSKKVTSPKDLNILKEFEIVLKQYGAKEVMDELSKESKDSLKKFLEKDSLSSDKKEIRT